MHLSSLSLSLSLEKTLQLENEYALNLITKAVCVGFPSLLIIGELLSQLSVCGFDVT